MSWVFLHWFSFLFTSWPYLHFFLLVVVFISCLAAAALFVTSIANCMPSWCGGVRLLCLLPLVLSFFLLFYFEWVSNLGVYPHCFLCHWYYCFGFFCFSFFKWNPSGSSKIASHGRNKFLCSQQSSFLSILTLLWLRFIRQAIFSFAVHYLINIIFPVRPQLPCAPIPCVVFH